MVYWKKNSSFHLQIYLFLSLKWNSLHLSFLIVFSFYLKLNHEITATIYKFFSKKKNHTNVLCFIHVYVWYHKHNIYIYPKHICLYIYRILKKSTNKTMKQARHLGSAGLFLYLFFLYFFFWKKKTCIFQQTELCQHL